jgi:hypothetical protein
MTEGIVIDFPGEYQTPRDRERHRWSTTVNRLPNLTPALPHQECY